MALPDERPSRAPDRAALAKAIEELLDCFLERGAVGSTRRPVREGHQNVPFGPR